MYLIYVFTETVIDASGVFLLKQKAGVMTRQGAYKPYSGPAFQQTESRQATPEEHQRLERLKQQQEVIRKQREQEVWKKASNLQNPSPGKNEIVTGNTVSSQSREESSLFTKLGLRRLFEK